MRFTKSDHATNSVHSRASGNPAPSPGSPLSRGTSGCCTGSTQPKWALMTLLSLLEEMQVIGRNRGLDWGARRERQIRIDAGDPDLGVAEANREKLLVAELLGDHDSALQPDLIVADGRSKPNMLRPHADGNRSTDAGSQIRKPPAGERELPSLAGQRKPLAVHRHVDGEEIHRRGADEARHEPVGRLAIKLERRSHLLDDTVLHHHDAVTQRHRF